MNYAEIIEKLQQLANPEKVIFKQKKFGIIAHNSLGIYHQDLKQIAQEIGKNNDLAIELYNSGIYEGRLLCSKIFNPKLITETLMEQWVKDFENWEVCDSFSMGVFAKSKMAVSKAKEWTSREREFEKRAGFTIMAAYCMADKKADNKVFESFIPYIIKESKDDRVYVKKAVNWALRSIGKRNTDLNKIAIETAYEIQKSDIKSAQWIAKDAISDLNAEKVNILDYPRSIYRV